MYKVEDYPQIKNNFFLMARNIGASRKLLGKVALTTVYAHRNSECWSSKSKKDYQMALNKAKAFLENEALRYGVTLEINLYHLNINIEKDADPFKCFDVIKNQIRSRSMDDLQNYYEGYFNADEAPIIVAFDEPGRSFAAMQHTPSQKIDEISMIFKRSGVFSYTSIAHELLHQFGATDYYFPQSVKEVAEKYLYNSVMGVGACVVDDLTAYLVGWKNTISANSYWFLHDTMWLTQSVYYDEIRKQWK